MTFQVVGLIPAVVPDDVRSALIVLQERHEKWLGVRLAVLSSLPIISFYDPIKPFKQIFIDHLLCIKSLLRVLAR